MFEIVLVAVIVDPTAPVYSLQARRPPTRMPRGFPPVQQLQCRDSGFVQSLYLLVLSRRLACTRLLVLSRVLARPVLVVLPMQFGSLTVRGSLGPHGL